MRMWTCAFRAISFSHPLRKTKGPTVTFGLDAFNVLNHVYYVTYIGVLNSPFFGEPVAAQPVRRLQASFGFRF